MIKLENGNNLADSRTNVSGKINLGQTGPVVALWKNKQAHYSRHPGTNDQNQLPPGLDH